MENLLFLGVPILKHIRVSANDHFSSSYDNYKYLSPTALRKAKIVYNFGLSKWNRVIMERSDFPKQIGVALV